MPRAVRQGDHYIINGVKRFITDADKSDFAQLMVVTDPAKGSHGGISCLLVDLNTPGCRITNKYKTMMGDEPCEIVYEDCRVPSANLVGKEGDGFKLAQGWLGVGRLKHGARALGVAERCIEMGAFAKRRGSSWEIARAMADAEGAMSGPGPSTGGRPRNSWRSASPGPPQPGSPNASRAAQASALCFIAAIDSCDGAARYNKRGRARVTLRHQARGTFAAG